MQQDLFGGDANPRRRHRLGRQHWVADYSFMFEYAYVDFLYKRKYEHTYLAYYNSMATARVAAHSKTAWVSMRYLKHIARVQFHSKTA